MKEKIKRASAYLILGFFILFFLRLIYGYFYPATFVDRNIVQDVSSVAFDFASRNYASEKFKVDRPGNNSQSYEVDQKYEKIASAASRTTNFDQDEKKIRALVAQHKALIQSEQKFGVNEARRINLAIGVPPEKFDNLVEEIKKIGNLSTLRIDKADKTNEYKDLNAKRASLEKIMEALIAIKNKNGNIAESIQLENRILEIENELQSLGVKLGDYDQENEFCTIKFGLEETGTNKGIPVATRIKTALEWTVKYYLLVITMLLVMSGFALVVVLLLEKSKILFTTSEK